MVYQLLRKTIAHASLSMCITAIFVQVVKGSSPLWIRILAQWVDTRDGPIRHVDGLKSEEFPGKDTVDKVWRHIVELYDEAPALGTRQLLAVHHEKQEGGRVFEKAIAHAIEETGSTILITSSELLGKIETLGKRCISLQTLIFFPAVNKDAPPPNLEPFRDTDTYIGYLPLAHILELDAELTSLCYGCKAIMDRIFKAVSEEVAASPRIMQELFKLNYERKRARYTEGYCSPFLDRIIFKKIRRLLGGQLRGVLSGGAPLNAETQRFMNICMCCPVVQGYGLTETCGAGCVADINDLSTGTVGPPVRCCEIVLREWAEGGYSPFNDPPQGEILITGENVSPGYFKQPEKTAEEFIMYKGKRYFCTGDIGEKRKDGSLIIVDRKKDLVKLQHGEYVSLAKVECALLNCPIVDNVCVYGYGLEANTVALVVPNLKHLEKIAEQVGETSRDLKVMCRNEKVEAEFLKQLNEHAKKSKLTKVEMPVAIHLCEEIWTPDSGLLTEALKLKRKPLQLKYQAVIDNMYDKLRLAS
ncbi:AMP-binding enzyme [Teladorsagia circumcincta]|uniref:long-chain-fatty-acid--CoA ligase n=1 Tax=Teladorsagia circumcincta TaxID=45464 RepID=A0A2G9UUH5_TELCI|nr:AMP-binding enzyme [Teladorsagia circumcincta]